MDIIISTSSSKPIYEQIYTQIKGQIMSQKLRAGDAVPSMRALARDLHISVITVQKAYEDLSRDGFIETSVGRGTFVAEVSGEFLREEQLKKCEEHLSIAADLAKSGGIEYETLASILRMFYNGEENV